MKPLIGTTEARALLQMVPVAYLENCAYFMLIQPSLPGLSGFFTDYPALRSAPLRRVSRFLYRAILIHACRRLLRWQLPCRPSLNQHRG